ncbi:MAG: MFS transporter, partial [bacterium]
YLSDRVPRRLIIFIGTAAGGLSLLGMSAAGPGALLFLLLAVMGACFISLRSVLFAYALDASPPHLGAASWG